MASSKRERRRWPALVVTALVVAVGGLVLIGRFPVGGPGSSPRFHEIMVPPDLRTVDAIPVAPASLAGHNLLLVTLDTTRADYIGCYGHEIAATPALDQLARDGALFSQAIAPSALTLPSHASMLTGLYPVHHGARTNAVSRLDGRNVTLAEVLSDGGYRTGAIVSAFVLDSQFGLDQGFRHYDDAMGDQPGGSIIRMLQRVGNETTDRAVAWLAAGRDKPFFLWVHYFDAHAPYEAPRPFSEQFDMPYDAEIAFADAQLARLMETLDDLALSDRTLVVVAADHGESLGQHDIFWNHYGLYPDTLHVPLFLRYPGGPVGVRVERSMRQIDIGKSLLELAGVGSDAFPGRELIHELAAEGARDVPRFSGGARYALQSEGKAVSLHQGRWFLTFVLEGGSKNGNPDWGVFETHTVELYDLEDDPKCERDLAVLEHEQAKRMRARLIEWLSSAVDSGWAAEGPDTEETRALLAQLGYAAGGAGVDAMDLFDPECECERCAPFRD